MSSPRSALAKDPTSLDTRGTSGTHLDPDPWWAYEVRVEVSEILAFAWPKRAKAMRDCGRTGVAMACKGCGVPSVFPFRCGARTCPTCARKGAAAITDRVAARAAVHDELMKYEPWDGPGSRQRRGWKMLTLTCPAVLEIDNRFNPTALREQVTMIRGAFRRFWRRTPYGRQTRDPGTRRKRSRRDTSYVFAEEVSPRGMVHLHVAVYGEYVPQKLLQELWSEVIGQPALVDIRSIWGNGQLAAAFREVLKYATKGEKGARADAAHAAAVELAFRNVRRVELGGALRRIKVTEVDTGGDDVREADLHDNRIARCEACGESGRWAWSGTVSIEIVCQNGGFGPLVALGGKPQRSPEDSARPQQDRAPAATAQ